MVNAAPAHRARSAPASPFVVDEIPAVGAPGRTLHRRRYGLWAAATGRHGVAPSPVGVFPWVFVLLSLRLGDRGPSRVATGSVHLARQDRSPRIGVGAVVVPPHPVLGQQRLQRSLDALIRRTLAIASGRYPVRMLAIGLPPAVRTQPNSRPDFHSPFVYSDTVTPPSASVSGGAAWYRSPRRSRGAPAVRS